MHQIAIDVSLTRFSPETLEERPKHHSIHDSLYSSTWHTNCAELGLTLLKLQSARDVTILRADISFDSMWIFGEE